MLQVTYTLCCFEEALSQNVQPLGAVAHFMLETGVAVHVIEVTSVADCVGSVDLRIGKKLSVSSK